MSEQAQPERTFPETDLTRYVLRTKSAPLSATGTHEVVATSITKTDLILLANAAYGPAWRRTFEIVSRARVG